jgi:hypothetical protein
MVGVKPKVGHWYTFCCEEDLKQIETDEELAEVVAETYDDGSPLYRFWPTREAAMVDLD